MSSRYGLWGPQALLDDLGKPHPEAIATVYFATVGAGGVVSVASQVPSNQIFADAIGSPLDNPLPTGVAEMQSGVDVHGNARFSAAPGYYAVGYVVGGRTRFVFAPVSNDPNLTLVNGGNYQNNTAYPAGSAVAYSGFAFLARVDVPSSNVTPPVDGATWMVLPPAGPAGGKGDAGLSGTVTVGTVMTVGPTAPATVTNRGTSTAAILDFQIPQGEQGDPGSAPNQTAVFG